MRFMWETDRDSSDEGGGDCQGGGEEKGTRGKRNGDGIEVDKLRGAVGFDGDGVRLGCGPRPGEEDFADELIAAAHVGGSA